MTKKIWFGADYNAEQWPEDVWAEDVRLMTHAGVNLATVGVFSWARLEPAEGEFDFVQMDRVIETLHAHGIGLDLATATASPPAWLSRQYPETLPVTDQGTRLWPGSRQSYCPSSPIYRDRAIRLVEKLAERYGEHPALEMWHINNEYACHVAECYCDVSAEAFRGWLRERYVNVDAVNAAWGTDFWSQRYGSFDEILPPRVTPTFRNPAQMLDYRRFSSDELLACYQAEARLLRSVTPSIPLTTNFIGLWKGVDYWRWSKEIDIISNDAYPDPADPESWVTSAMGSDLMRSLARGKRWLLMEQAPSAVQWRRHNAAKRAGQMRATSYQTLARGADGIMYFQWRQSVRGAERFHSGLVPHSGTDTRVWREVVALGGELAMLSAEHIEGIVGHQPESQVALVFSWDSWWAIEQDANPTEIRYLDAMKAWHSELTRRGVVVDFVEPGGDLSGYRVVIAPHLFVASDADLLNLNGVVERGDVLAVTYLSAINDEQLCVRSGGYLGSLSTTLGVWIEEFTPPAAADPQYTNTVQPPLVPIEGEALGGPGVATTWAEHVRVIDAEVRAVFAQGDGSWPAVTRKKHSAGSAWYVATQPTGSALETLVTTILTDAGLNSAPTGSAGPDVEMVARGDVTVVINHGTGPYVVDLDGLDLLSGQAARQTRLEQYGVAVVHRFPRDMAHALTSSDDH
ncbi:beta-galactosidase [Microcella sp.]|uniref:beta-galactosidase n=1 Tax=Microcella sp. TaxID=1913979 RepID=UPI003F6F067E